jgi:hypothetical protein
MYIDSALIYIMVARIRNAIWPPPPQFFLHRRAALTTNSNGTQSAHKWKGWGYGLDNLLISMSGCQWCRYIRDAKIEKFDTKWNANERLRKGQELKIYQTVPVPKTYMCKSRETIPLNPPERHWQGPFTETWFCNQ